MPSVIGAVGQEFGCEIAGSFSEPSLLVRYIRCCESIAIFECTSKRSDAVPVVVILVRKCHEWNEMAIAGSENSIKNTTYFSFHKFKFSAN